MLHDMPLPPHGDRFFLGRMCVVGLLCSFWLTDEKISSRKGGMERDTMQKLRAWKSSKRGKPLAIHTWWENVHLFLQR